MDVKINQIIQKAYTAHKENKLEYAELLYKSILEIQPENINIHNNLGAILKRLGKFEEAEISFKKSIKLKSNYPEAYVNLGNLQIYFNKLEEAEINFKKAIELNPDFPQAYKNLALALVKLNKSEEAEACLRKAIELKADYFEAYFNLGVLYYTLGRFEDAISSYRKSLDINPKYEEAHNNLVKTFREQKLKKIIKDIRLDKENNTALFEKTSTKLFKPNINLDSTRYDTRLNLNPFITQRKVNIELITSLYKINTTKLEENIADSGHLRYGNGRCSNYELFENDSSLIKSVANDLTIIMKHAVKSEIFIMESFFNIFQTKSGITSHHHIDNFDKINRLTNQKFSLTYYLDVGDQTSSEPGVLKLYNPNKEILPSNGQIIIFPANRKHSAVYNGKLDRVMMGVNFYSLLS